MASAAVALQKAFGIDRGLPFPVTDIAHADVVLLVGANPSETMPPLMQHFDEQRRLGGRLVVIEFDERQQQKGPTCVSKTRPAPTPGWPMVCSTYLPATASSTMSSSTRERPGSKRSRAGFNRFADQSRE